MTDLLTFHLNQALRRFPNDPDLLALKGSRGDTLSDEEILRYLKDKMATGKVIQEAMPQRIQRRRTKGWRMPENTVCVTRPGRWGNPARIGDYFMVGDPGGHSGWLRMSWCKTSKEYADSRFTFIDSAATAVAMFRKLAPTYYKAAELAQLRGKNLACWCALDQPCHADVLLELANS